MKEKIRCPKCGWVPVPRSHWECFCGHLWNTFDTAGKCPVCNKSWSVTQCFWPEDGGCGEISLHIDWYADLDRKLKDGLMEMFKYKPVIKKEARWQSVLHIKQIHHSPDKQLFHVTSF
jgi:hypothetical protein